MSHLALYLFGPPQIKLDNAPIKLSRYKAIALMAYLAITAETHNRNTLATLLWPNHDQRHARAALRRTLVTLNRTGIGNWIEADRETIGLKRDPDLWVDVSQFQQQLTACLASKDDSDDICLPLLTEAIALYQADFMAGFTLRDSPNFDEWQLTQTEKLRRDLASTLARLIRCHIAQGNLEQAIINARQWLQLDPFYELAHRQLMQLYTWNDQRSAALRQYQECVQILKQELDVSPSEETTALYERIQQGQESVEQNVGKNAPIPRKFSPLLQAASPLHNFPTQSTPFIGRQTELAEIIKRLHNPDCQLLTLVGPGGLGKTRLAIQTAIEQGTAYPDGLYFIPLASVSSPDFLVSTLADSLGLSLDRSEEPLLQLIHRLKNKNLLLVMDNFEHLIKRANLLIDILTQTPHIKMLVTSQERLNLQGEWIFDIKGMDYPTGSDNEPIENYSAVALFLNRAYRIHSEFSPTETEKQHIIRICQLVEGNPLAIELAASWVRYLSCQDIAQEIEQMYTTQHNLDFLATTWQDVPERHQSLRGVFEHSWQLLSTEEKEVFKRLSVFRGGCRREAIAAVTGASLPLISTLVDKSLLIRSTPRRYEMHGLVRQYAAEKLQQTPLEAKQVQDSHCEYFTTFLQERESRLKGEKQRDFLTEIAKEIENIRAAWQWAITQQKITEIKNVLEGLWYFYAVYSWFKEGAETFGQAISQLLEVKEGAEDEQHIILIGQIQAYQGWFLLRQGLYDQAKALLQQSINIFEHLQNQEIIAAPLHYLGILYREVGQLAKARQLLEQSVNIYRKANNQWGTAWSLSNLAYCTSELGPAYQSEAKKFLQECLAIYKTIGNKQGLAIALNNLGYLAYKQGDSITAKELFEESLVLRQKIGFPRGIAVVLNNLGHVTGTLKDYQSCKKYYHKSLEISTEIQTIPLTLAALGGLSVPFASEGKPEWAFELLTIVLQHPASNKETQDRATEFLVKLKPTLPAEVTAAIQADVKERPKQLEAIVAHVLAQR